METFLVQAKDLESLNLSILRGLMETFLVTAIITVIELRYCLTIERTMFWNEKSGIVNRLYIHLM